MREETTPGLRDAKDRLALGAAIQAVIFCSLEFDASFPGHSAILSDHSPLCRSSTLTQGNIWAPTRPHDCLVTCRRIPPSPH